MPTSAFEDHVTYMFHHKNHETMADIHASLAQVAMESGAAQHLLPRDDKPWNTSQLKELRAARRSCRDARERRQLSKKISNEMRRVLRQWQSQKLQSTLEKFSDLKKLSRICSNPVQRSCTICPDDASLASVFEVEKTAPIRCIGYTHNVMYKNDRQFIQR